MYVIMIKIWEPQHNRLLSDLKVNTKIEPFLMSPESNKSFYLKTDWFEGGKAAVMLEIDKNTMSDKEEKE